MVVTRTVRYMASPDVKTAFDVAKPGLVGENLEDQHYKEFLYYLLCFWRDRRQNVSQLAPFSMLGPMLLGKVRINDVFGSAEKVALACFTIGTRLTINIVRSSGQNVKTCRKSEIVSSLFFRPCVLGPVEAQVTKSAHDNFINKLHEHG